MLGTWGTDLGGASVDEHHVTYEVGESDRAVFRRATNDGTPFTVFDNCPIVVQLERETQVVGRGWVACTPIQSAGTPIGMLFNDAGLTGASVDDSKQHQAAIFCSLLGALLDRATGLRDATLPGPALSVTHPLVRRVLQGLADHPSLTGKVLAGNLGISYSRLARLFHAEVGMSLVEYRNRLRLERFSALVDAGDRNLFRAAQEAGFGSYAQFHRILRASRGVPPREYLRERCRLLPPQGGSK